MTNTNPITYQVPLVGSDETVSITSRDLVLFRTKAIVGRNSMPLLGVFIGYRPESNISYLINNRILRLRDDGTVRKYDQRRSFTDIQELKVGIDDICESLESFQDGILRPHITWVRELTSPYELGIQARLKVRNRIRNGTGKKF